MSVPLTSKIIIKDWIDYNGHMNLSYYILVFDMGAEVILSKFKMGEQAAKTTKRSTMVVETHTNYIKEVRQSDEVIISLSHIDHDIVIIDTPPKIESDARPAIEAADLVLIPIAASHVDFWATGAIVEIAQKANKKILVQINRSSQRSKLIDKTNDFIKSLNLTSTKTIIGNRQIYTSSMGEGKTAVEKQKKGSAVEEIKNLSEQIILEL